MTKKGQTGDSDTPPTAEEKTRARALRRHVERMLAGEPPPPAMDADDRDLLETATAIHAALGEARLSAARKDALLDGLFARPGETPEDNVVPLRGPARPRVRRLLLAAGLGVAAAVVILSLRGASRPPAPPELVERLPLQERSRPADVLIGPIAETDTGEARARLDTLYADRMSGYRSVWLKERGVR